MVYFLEITFTVINLRIAGILLHDPNKIAALVVTLLNFLQLLRPLGRGAGLPIPDPSWPEKPIRRGQRARCIRYDGRGFERGAQPICHFFGVG